MHVGDLDGSKAPSKKNWKATVTIYVHDANDNPLANATVSGSWSGGYTGTAAATTDSSGKCSVTTGNMSNSKASVTFKVTNMTCSGYTYESSTNHDPDGDSNGTQITVTR